MFGKLIKNLLGKAEEAVESISNTANETIQNNEPLPNSNQQEINYTSLEFTDIINYTKQIPDIDKAYNTYYSNFYEAIYTGDKSKIDQRTKEWKDYLVNCIAKVREMNTYNGDDSLINTGVKYFTDKLNLIDSHFVKYAESTLTKADNQSELYDEAENIKSDLFKRINSDLEKFREKYNNFYADAALEETYKNNEKEILDKADTNPLLQPIHGVSLFDYAAGTVKIGAGTPESEVLSILGFDKPQWDEAGFTWQQRMEEDPEMAVMTLYSKYFGELDKHPKLGNSDGTNTSQTQVSENLNFERIKNDEKFYYELAAEREAAAEVGKDGGQYILDKYGINLIDFQAQAMVWMRSGNVQSMITYQYEKKEEYLAKFQKEMGGTIADDIDF